MIGITLFLNTVLAIVLGVNGMLNLNIMMIALGALQLVAGNYLYKAYRNYTEEEVL